MRGGVGSQLTCALRWFLQVYSILRHVAEVLEYTKDEQLESLYQRTAWVFDEKYKRPGYGAYDVFKQAVSWVPRKIPPRVWIQSASCWFLQQMLHFNRDPTILDGLDLTEEERSVLIDNINRRLTPQAVKIRAGLFILGWIAQDADEWMISFFFSSADIEVACYGYEGIDAVKEALRAGLACSTEVMPIKVIPPPPPSFLLLIFNYRHRS